MKHPATRELFAYWNQLRGERTAPQRCEIDPAAIRNVLADTFMLDVDGDGRYPIRLAGTRVNALFDVDQKGRSFLDAWRPEERRNVTAVLLTVTDGACAVVAGGVMTPAAVASASVGGHACAFELLVLPLRHYGKTHSRVLGMIKPASAPAWLGVLPVGELSLRSLRVINDADLEMRAVAPIAVGQDSPAFHRPGFAGLASQGPASEGLGFPGVALAEPGFTGASRSRPYLRLIQGGA